MSTRYTGSNVCDTLKFVSQGQHYIAYLFPDGHIVIGRKVGCGIYGEPLYDVLENQPAELKAAALVLWSIEQKEDVVA